MSKVVVTNGIEAMKIDWFNVKKGLNKQAEVKCTNNEASNTNVHCLFLRAGDGR